MGDIIESFASTKKKHMGPSLQQMDCLKHRNHQNKLFKKPRNGSIAEHEWYTKWKPIQMNLQSSQNSLYPLREKTKSVKWYILLLDDHNLVSGQSYKKSCWFV